MDERARGVRIFGRAWGGAGQGERSVRDVVAASGLFEPDYYRAENPDVASAGLEALDHFLEYGWREGRRPNLYFDPAWYRATHGTGVPIEENPLLHYIRCGESKGLRPEPRFDPDGYRRVADVPCGTSALAHFLAHRRSQGVAADAASDMAFYADRGPIAASGLFDVNQYLIGSPDVREAGRDPIFHFHADGWREGRRPNLYFDPLWYRARHLSGASSENPLAHYIARGEASGCAPVCYFDPAWYRRSYGVPRGTLALAHFLAHRRSQRVAPNPHFDLAFYLARHGAEIGPNRDPFAHLLRWGATRDLDPSPAFDSAAYRARSMNDESMDAPMDERRVPLVHHLERLSRASAEQA